VPALVALRCRTSERTAAAPLGTEELALLIGKRFGSEPRLIGTFQGPREARFEDDLRDGRGCLLEAGGQVDDALTAGNTPVLLAAECSIALTTLPTALAHRPDAKVLWLDAHGDFNTPETTTSGYLGGMALAGATGMWDAGLGAGRVEPASVVLAGVRDLDPGEREALEASEVTVIGASPVETLVAVNNALDGAPVYLHIDLDVIDPEHFPAQFPAPSGLAPEKLFDLLDSVATNSEIVGLEVTAFEAPADNLERQVAASTALHVLEPLLDAIPERADVGN
jgi:arginase family enzyme